MKQPDIAAIHTKSAVCAALCCYAPSVPHKGRKPQLLQARTRTCQYSAACRLAASQQTAWTNKSVTAPVPAE